MFGLTGATTMLWCDLPINFFNREGLAIEITAGPVAHFLMLFMVGVGEGVEGVIKPRDASAVVRRTRETSIDTVWAGNIRQERQQLLEGRLRAPSYHRNHRCRRALRRGSGAITEH